MLSTRNRELLIVFISRYNTSRKILTGYSLLKTNPRVDFLIADKIWPQNPLLSRMKPRITTLLSVVTSVTGGGSDVGKTRLPSRMGPE